MSSLLEQEDEDDFYKTTYGGFQEEEEDIDYRLVFEYSWYFVALPFRIFRYR